MLEVEFRKVGTVGVLDLSGTIDIDSANLIEAVGWCLNNGHLDILLNFESVNMVNYAGLSVLTIAYKDVINHNGRIKFANVPVHVEKALCFVCLDGVFEIYVNEESALHSFKEDKAIAAIKKMPLRRRFKRVDLDINVEFRLKGKNEEFSRGKALNLSAVGVLICAGKSYPLGEILEVKLFLAPKPGLVQLDAKVSWLIEREVQPQIYPGMGLEFYNLDSRRQGEIVEYVERNLPLNCSPE